MLLALTPAQAQTAAQAGQDSSGDALSRNLRTLAANPKSLSALMGAGKAALELGDAQAAITFFGRAEEQAPRDGRIKMWIGSALVHLQQPQPALRFFDEAVSLGVAEAEVAGERGLAYDISGDPRRAQRDYRHALTRGRDAEITRRLALSLAISGEREPALQLLQEQLAMRDKAAERTRAFVLALTGDGAGAARTVQAAMPYGQGAALAPFLERLASLNTVDRALAVHLGHFPRGGRSTAPTPPPRSYASVDSTLRAGAPDTSRASLGQRVTPPAAATPAQTKRDVPLSGVRTATAAPQTQLPKFEPRPVQLRARPLQSAQTPAAEQRPIQIAQAAPAAQQPVQIAQAAPAAQQPVQIAAAAPAVQQPVQSAAAAPAPTLPVLAETAAATAPAAGAGTETQIMNAPGFSIVSSAQPPASAAAAEESRRVSRLAEVAATLASLPEAPVIETPAPKPAAPVAKRAAPAPAAAKKEPAPAVKKEVLAKKDVPAKGTAAAAKKDTAAAKKEAPAAKKPATPAEPRRIWVQVAGGADKAALPREFARLKGKAPKLLAARTAWTTPLKATNRLLVGPFKTDKEAQDFVNELKKADLTGFAFTSEAGQKIEKLAAK
jgi:Flp pilus assembly protein TadD